MPPGRSWSKLTVTAPTPDASAPSAIPVIRLSIAVPFLESSMQKRVRDQTDDRCGGHDDRLLEFLELPQQGYGRERDHDSRHIDQRASCQHDHRAGNGAN